MASDSDSYFREHAAYEGLGRASARSGVVIFSSRIASIAIQFGGTVVLARLLDPKDFGLVAVVAALALFAPILVDLGTADATSQKAKITRDEIDSLFWLNVTVGTAAMAVFAACSWLIARGFGQPELLQVSLVWSLTFLMSALPVQHVALMRRAMEFHRIAAVDISANLISSAVAIGLALGGFEYWALVARALLGATLMAVGAWVVCGWRPGRPKFIDEARSLVKFGLGVTGFTIIDTASRSSDRVALGYFAGPTSLGYFHNAYVLYANALTPLTDPMHGLALSSLSKMTGDPVALKRAWAKALAMLSFWSAPAFAGLSVVAYEFVIIIMGEKWAPAGVLLSIIALRGIANVVERTHGWLHVVMGHPGRWTRWGIIAALCQLVALAIGLPFGATGVATTYTISMFLLFIPSVVYSGRDIGLTVRDVLAAVGFQVLGALIAVVVGFMFKFHVVDGLSNIPRFILTCIVVGSVYMLVVVGIFRVREPLNVSFKIARGMLSRNQ